MSFVWIQEFVRLVLVVLIEVFVVDVSAPFVVMIEVALAEMLGSYFESMRSMSLSWWCWTL